ncbi:MAG: 50S ribosomal protein L5 [Candidatus Kaiserbacteria bacterium]|nr:50S ribosomal protein L5 [Candidatus Kaiserbacteria bacterium]
MITIQTKINGAFDALKSLFQWKNALQVPRVEKIVISTGTGRVRKEKQTVVLIQDRLAKITGQKVVPRKARKSIASFKLRDGETVGFMTTLRGKNMYAFLDKLINVAIPRMRDFRGIPHTSVDEMGNLTIGVPEHTIFPETPDENLQDIFGMSVTIVTTAQNRDEALAFLRHIGVPFIRTEG